MVTARRTFWRPTQIRTALRGCLAQARATSSRNLRAAPTSGSHRQAMKRRLDATKQTSSWVNQTDERRQVVSAWSHSGMRGWRPTMEDSVVTVRFWERPRARSRWRAPQLVRYHRRPLPNLRPHVRRSASTQQAPRSASPSLTATAATTARVGPRASCRAGCAPSGEVAGTTRCLWLSVDPRPS